MAKKKRGFWQMVKDMKELDQMDRDERDTVTVSCLSGIAIGMILMFFIAACVGTVVVYAVMQ